VLLVLPVVDVLPDPAVVSSFRPLVRSIWTVASVPPPVALVWGRRIADKAVARFKDRVRDLTRRHRGVSLERMIADLNPLLRGWAGYFGFSQSRDVRTRKPGANRQSDGGNL
jgi:hypothetical protein